MDRNALLSKIINHHDRRHFDHKLSRPAVYYSEKGGEEEEVPPEFEAVYIKHEYNDEDEN